MIDRHVCSKTDDLVEQKLLKIFFSFYSHVFHDKTLVLFIGSTSFFFSKLKDCRWDSSSIRYVFFQTIGCLSFSNIKQTYFPFTLFYLLFSRDPNHSDVEIFLGTYAQKELHFFFSTYAFHLYITIWILSDGRHSACIFLIYFWKGSLSQDKEKNFSMNQVWKFSV